jgi:hypothetical protein
MHSPEVSGDGNTEPGLRFSSMTFPRTAHSARKMTFVFKCSRVDSVQLLTDMHSWPWLMATGTIELPLYDA